MKRLIFRVLTLCSAFLCGCMIQNDVNRVYPQDMKLHPETESFVKSFRDSGIVSAQNRAMCSALNGDFSELRKIRSSRLKNIFIPPEDVLTLDFTIPSNDGKFRIPARIYRKKSPDSASGKSRPAVVFFHGGGWTFGGIGSCARYCSELVRAADCVVLAVDYRLAPENPFPVPLNDCVRTLEWAFERIADYGGDPDRIVVSGDSSGGNLAAASALVLAEKPGEKMRLSGMLLFYPVVLARADDGASWKSFGMNFGLDAEQMDLFNACYLPDSGKARNIYASPLFAGHELLANFPPVLIISARCDILFDQGVLFAEKLMDSGVKTDFIAFRGATHLFLTVPGQDFFFSRAVWEAARFVRKTGKTSLQKNFNQTKIKDK